MKITDMKTTVISVPYTEPEHWAWGVRLGLTAIIIEISTDSGIMGLGESTPFTGVEYALGVLNASRQYLKDQDPFDIERIMYKISQAGYHHGADLVLAGVETALWDTVGKACDKPLYKLIGGEVRTKIPFAPWLWIRKPEEMGKDAAKFVDEGFKSFYIKVGLDPKEDLEHVKAVRDAIGPDYGIRVDANRAWTVGEAVKLISKMEPYDIEFVEEPTSLYGMPRVRESVRTPIAAGDSAGTPYEVLEVVNQRAADIISHIDPDMQGGILNSKKACAICEMAKMATLPVVAHTGTDLGIATNAILHLVASTPNFLYPNQSVYMYLSDDIRKDGKIPFENGCMTVPDEPGLGIELDQDRMRKYEKLYREKGMMSSYGEQPGLEEVKRVLPPRFWM